jgi:hypothetical protein
MNPSQHIPQRPSRAHWIPLTLILALLAAVAPPVAAADGDDVAKLRERAERFWQGRVQDDWGVVFDIMPPEEQQVAGEREKFIAYQKEKGWFKYISAQMGDVAVDRDLGWVHVTFVTGLRQYPTMPHQTSTVWDLWQKTDDWRPVPRAYLDMHPTRPPTVRPAAEESALARRVDATWKAREAQDFAALYDLLEPAYRQRVTKEDFLKRKSKYLYLKHAIQWVEVFGATAKSKVGFVQKLNDPTLYKIEPEEQLAFEEWVKVDGEWYRKMEMPKGSD